MPGMFALPYQSSTNRILILTVRKQLAFETLAAFVYFE